MKFQERISQYPNRRRLKLVKGYTDVYDIEREDGLEIVREKGTQLTAKWLNEWTSGIETTNADSAAKAADAVQRSQNAESQAVDAVSKSESAVTNASDAVSRAQNALEQSSAAMSCADNAFNQAQSSFSVSNSANGLAEAARSDAASANLYAAAALEKASQIEAQANSGAFNGRDAALVETRGMFGLRIIDGDLWVCYHGDTAPDLRINESGELIYNY